MSNQSKILQMLGVVADHLGEELLAKMAFVGGCTTGLLITDTLTLEQIRATDDVDVIVEVLGHGDYTKLQQQLRERGFRESSEDDVVCRWRLNFLATKITAFQHRGNQDFLASRDMEDILSLIDGREDLCDEVLIASDDVRLAIAEAIHGFLQASDFEYAVQSIAQDFQREQLIFKRLDKLTSRRNRV